MSVTKEARPQEGTQTEIPGTLDVPPTMSNAQLLNECATGLLYFTNLRKCIPELEKLIEFHIKELKAQQEHCLRIEKEKTQIIDE